MSDRKQCDQCERLATDPKGWLALKTPPWLETVTNLDETMLAHVPHHGWQLDFCSWGCLRNYASERPAVREPA